METIFDKAFTFTCEADNILDADKKFQAETGIIPTKPNIFVYSTNWRKTK